MIVQDMLRCLGNAGDLQHVEMTAWRGTVRCEGNRHAARHHLHDWCRAAGWCVGHMRACLSQNVDFFV